MVACVIFLIVLCRIFVAACGIYFHLWHVGSFCWDMWNLFSCSMWVCFSCGMQGVCCSMRYLYLWHVGSLLWHVGSFSCGMQDLKLRYVGSFYLWHQNFHCGMWDLLLTACKVFWVATRRIFSCGMWHLQLWHAGSLVVACGIFLIVLCRNFVAACGISFHLWHVGSVCWGMWNRFSCSMWVSFSCGMQGVCGSMRSLYLWCVGSLCGM